MANNWYSAQLMLYKSRRNPPAGSDKVGISRQDYLVKVAKLMTLPTLRERAVVWLEAAVKHLLKPDPKDQFKQNVTKKVRGGGVLDGMRM